VELKWLVAKSKQRFDAAEHLASKDRLRICRSDDGHKVTSVFRYGSIKELTETTPMALMPKRVKHRKSQRGRIKGNATRGNTVVFGDYGLQATRLVGSTRRRSKLVVLLLSSTFVVKVDCTSAYSPTNP
jgi:hypothetical protein